jgi:hypothetical protein
MRIDDLNSIIRLAGIKRKLVEAETLRINPLTGKITTDPDAETNTAPSAPAVNTAPSTNATASNMYPPGTQFTYVTPQSQSSNSGSSSSGALPTDQIPWAKPGATAPAAKTGAAPAPAAPAASGSSGIAQELERQYREIMAARQRAGLDAPTKPGTAAAPAAKPAAGTSPTPQQAAKERTLLPVDPELKKVQATIAKVPKFKELLGKFGEAGDGVDGRMGPFTKAAIITYLEYIPDAATTPEFKNILNKYKIPVPPSFRSPAPAAAPAAAPKGPNGEPLVKNAKGEIGYMKQQGRGQTFVPYTPPVKENAELAELIRLTHRLK